MLFSQNGTGEKAMDAIFVALKYKFDFARICRVNYRPFGDCCVSRRNAVGKARETVLDIAYFCVVFLNVYCSSSLFKISLTSKFIFEKANHFFPKSFKEAPM